MQRRWNRPLMMILFLFAIASSGHGTLAARETSVPSLMVDHLRVEHDENPLGLGTRTPRLSWWIHGDARGIAQAEYQVQVARTADDLTRGRKSRLGLETCTVQRVHAPSLRWPGGRVAASVLLASSRVGLDESRVRVEYAVLVGDGPS